MADPAAIIDQVAARLQRLAPSHRDPLHFHEEKSELVGLLREAATVLRVLPGPKALRVRGRETSLEVGKSQAKLLIGLENEACI